MPYTIRKDGPPDNPFCVYKETGSDALGCHASESMAWRQVMAIEISMHREQKALSETPDLRLGLLVTTNAYKDRERQIIRQKALEDWVTACWKEDGSFGQQNPLLFWHGGEPIGDIVFAGMQGPFLIEVSRERPDTQVNLMPPGSPPLMASTKAIWDAFEEMPVEWGASHEFLYLKEDATDGVYDRIVKTETSVLPRGWAANAYTLFSIIKEQ